MSSCRFFVVAFTWFTVSWALPRGLGAAENARQAEIELALSGALFQGDAPAPGGPTLLVDLRCSDGRWERAWGIARSFNVANHTGRVTEAKPRDEGAHTRQTVREGEAQHAAEP